MSFAVNLILTGVAVIAALFWVFFYLMISRLPPAKRANAEFPRVPTIIPERELLKGEAAIEEMQRLTVAKEVSEVLPLWVEGPTIDAYYHAVEALDLILDLQNLPLDRIYLPIGGIETINPRRHSVAAFVEKNFWNGSIFTLRPGSSEEIDESIYAIDSAVRILCELRGDDVVYLGEKEDECLDNLKKSYDYVLKLRVDGLFKNRARVEPTLLSSFSALSTLRTLQNLSLQHGVFSLNGYKFEESLNALNDPHFQEKIEPDLLAYRFYPSDKNEGCVCSTFYNIRSTMFASRTRDEGIRMLGVRMSENADRITRFIRNCWVKSDTYGGFSYRPGKENHRDIIHTRYSLQILKLLLQSGAIGFEQLSWLEPASIMRYVMSCENWGGFGKAERLPAALCPTRAGINIAKQLRCFALWGVFPLSEEYLLEQRRFEQKVKAIEAFISSCWIDEANAYQAFPKDSPASVKSGS